MGIVWLASYPKSGNTWVRFLLYTLLYGPPQRSIDVARRIPDVHRPIPFEAPASGPLLAKTHFALTPRHPKLDQTERAVLVLRHPRDILLSGLNYRRLGGMDAAQMPDRAYAEAFIAAAGDPGWVHAGFGSWPQHARSWRAAAFPVLTVRYEDLKADTPAALRAIAGFCAIDADDAALARAAKTASFDNLRAMEVREKAGANTPAEQRLFVGDCSTARAGVFFMNAGRTGQSLEPIGKGLDAAFDAAFGPALAELGYAPQASS